jgi:hypothetical protein
MFYMLIRVYSRGCIVAVYDSISGEISYSLDGLTDRHSRHMLERANAARNAVWFVCAEHVQNSVVRATPSISLSLMVLIRPPARRYREQFEAEVDRRVE